MIHLFLIFTLLVCFFALNWNAPIYKTIYEQIGIKTCLMESPLRQELQRNPLPKDMFPIINSMHGWGNGYVVIPKWHRLYSVPIDELELFAHGSITWSDYIAPGEWEWREGLTPNDLDKRIIGFDTGHAWDTIEDWPKERVQLEANKLLDQVVNYNVLISVDLLIKKYHSAIQSKLV